MKKLVGKFFIKMMGWDIDPSLPAEIKKCVLVMGPHTSNWDYFIGMMAFWGYYDIDLKQLIKSDLFFFPLGWILKKSGGIPVYRDTKNNMTTTISNMYKNEKELTITFTPEGTRSYSPKWKKGFYYIALDAKVPIVLGFIDYKNKTGGMLPTIIIPSGDIEKDIELIKLQYKNISGRYPEKGIY
jgi:1-acyl-sn-glycerol-3-phosphate acyltransferase